MKITPSIPKGTRDFDASTLYKRQYIINAIKAVYDLYGFEPIETPTMEKLQILNGKYGDEGDQLLFKVLNNGDFLQKAEPSLLEKKDSASVAPAISSKGLRYDLTVPFARYVAQHRNEISFPFKRYQVQSVWRADRPQKGRYREFLQCDADVIGTDSLIAESEFLQIYDAVFRRLGLHDAVVKLNNRKILSGLAESIGAADLFMQLTIAIDKLDKIGMKAVADELSENGFTTDQIDEITDILNLQEQEGNILPLIAERLQKSELAQQGVRELTEIVENNNELSLNHDRFTIDITLARGLSYYTGTIFEAVVPDSGIGSISGGGRYDDLTELFGFPNVSGVGISFGIDRIFDVIDHLNKWPTYLAEKKSPTRVLVTYMNTEVKGKVVDFMEKLRANGIASEMYLEPAKLGKQFKYANDKGIPHVVVIGPEEIEKGEYQVKFMKSGQQQSLPPAYIINALKPKQR